VGPPVAASAARGPRRRRPGARRHGRGEPAAARTGRRGRGPADAGGEGGPATARPPSLRPDAAHVPGEKTDAAGSIPPKKGKRLIRPRRTDRLCRIPPREAFPTRPQGDRPMQQPPAAWAFLAALLVAAPAPTARAAEKIRV